MDASHGRASQLAALTQGPPVDTSVHPWGPGGRRRGGGGRKYRVLGKSMSPFTAWAGLSQAFIGQSPTRVEQADTHAWGMIWKKDSGKTFFKSRFGQE